jgi:hypothetical protein
MPAKLDSPPDELPLDPALPEPLLPKPPNPDFAGFGVSSLTTTTGDAVAASAKVTSVRNFEVMFEIDRHGTSGRSTGSTSSR